MKHSLKTTVAITLLVVSWGLAWPIYKSALPYTPPLLFAGMRALLGGLVLTLFIIPTWRKIRFRKNWAKYCISASLNTILFFGLQTVGLVFMPGGLFSVLVYLQPVLITVFAWIWLGEHMSKLKVIGLIVGFVGILTISSSSLSGEISGVGIVIALLTATGWALGTVYVKKVSSTVNSLWMISLQLVLGGVFLTCLGLLVEDASTIIWSSTYLFALGYGATFGIPFAFILYFWLMTSGDSGKVASFTFLVPLISVLVGTIFMSEPFTLPLFIGLILIVLSISFVNYPGSKNKQEVAENIKSIS